MQKKKPIWTFKPLPDANTVAHLQEVLGIHEFFTSFLARLGISTFEEARHYFRAGTEALHPPLLMKDMDVAVQYVADAIAQEKKILFFGDYDVDGTTSVALISSYFKNFYPNFLTYIPDRYTEGYGLSKAGMDCAVEQECSLVIALDCGIKGHQVVDYAKSLGLQIIICDHHQPGDTLPAADAVLDPLRSDCAYPYKYLSGCGVGFKLCQAIGEHYGHPSEWLHEQLDLLALSIGADIVSITGENRILAAQGLKELHKQKRPGIAKMLELAGKKRLSGIEDLVFTIGPRINAAGRIKHGEVAVRLLTSTDEQEVEDLAQALQNQNNTRRVLDKSITEEAIRQVEAQNNPDSATTIVHSKDWHKGVIGIVASRLVEVYYKPTLVFTHNNGVMAASGRSVDGFNLYEALDACREEMIQFGGHMAAAGLSVEASRFEAFCKRFEEEVAKRITPDQKNPKLLIDGQLVFSDITPKFMRLHKELEPFGPGNMNPVFVSRNLKAAEGTKIIGGTQEHLRLMAYTEATGEVMECVGFGMADYYTRLMDGEVFHIAYHLEENEWNGSVRNQLRLLDLKFAKDAQ